MRGEEFRQGAMQARSPLADRRNARSRPGAVTQHAVGGPGRRPGQRAARYRPYPGRIGAEQGEDLAGQPEPGGLPPAGGVVDARRGGGVDQRDDLAGHVDGPGGLAVLVVHHVDRWPPVLELDHRTDEARPVRPVQPRRPDDKARSGQAVEHGPLAGQLGAPVGGARRRDIVLRIRPAGITCEDIVGRDLHEPGAESRTGRGQVRRAASVDGQRLFLGRLGIVDRGPGRAVDDHIRPAARDRIGDSGGVGHVQAGPVHPGHRLAAGGQDGDHVGAEHAASPGDQPPGHDARPDPAGAGAGLCRLSGSHQARLPAYQRTVASRPWRNRTLGAYPMARRVLSSRE